MEQRKKRTTEGAGFEEKRINIPNSQSIILNSHFNKNKAFGIQKFV